MPQVARGIYWFDGDVEVPEWELTKADFQELEAGYAKMKPEFRQALLEAARELQHHELVCTVSAKWVEIQEIVKRMHGATKFGGLIKWAIEGTCAKDRANRTNAEVHFDNLLMDAMSGFTHVLTDDEIVIDPDLPAETQATLREIIGDYVTIRYSSHRLLELAIVLKRSINVVEELARERPRDGFTPGSGFAHFYGQVYELAKKHGLPTNDFVSDDVVAPLPIMIHKLLKKFPDHEAWNERIPQTDKAVATGIKRAKAAVRRGVEKTVT